MTATERALRRRALLAAVGAVTLAAAGITTVVRSSDEIRPIDFTETADPARPQETLLRRSAGTPQARIASTNHCGVRAALRSA